MIHVAETFRRGLIGALAILVAGTISASAQMAPMAPHMPAPPRPPPGLLKLSDTIQVFGIKFNQCAMQSEAGDKDERPEPKVGPVNCVFSGKVNGMFRVTVAGNPDETIICQCTVSGKPPNLTVRGKGREGVGPGAYSVVINGSLYGSVTNGSLIVRVWEPPSAP